MENTAFEALKNDFRQSDTDGKISIYLDADGLTHGQYKELLQLFPLNDLHKLELALG